MSDEPTTPDTDPVSFDKRSTPAGRPAKNTTAAGGPMPAPPSLVRYAAIALAVSGLGALVGALSLFGQKGWLFRQATKSNAKLKLADQKTPSELHHSVSTTVTTNLIASLILVLAVTIAARAVLKGRYWSRWAVIGLWVLATFTGTFAGFTYIINVASSEPIAFKIPTFVAAVSFIVAVVLVSLRPSADYFNLTRPARPEGAPARRGGLFGPRPARPGFSAPAGADRSAGSRASGTKASTRAATKASTRAATKAATQTAAKTATTRPAGAPAPERARAKQRAAADSAASTAKGADLARARAKASKSRRSGV